MKFIQTKLYRATMYQRNTFLNDLRLSRSHQYVFYVYRKSHSNVSPFLVVIFSGLLSFFVLSLFNRLYSDLCRSGCSWYSRENSFYIYPALFHFHLIPLVALRLRFYLSFCPLVSIPVLSPPPSRRRSAARPDWPVHVCTTAAITISSRAFLSARSYVRSEMNWVIVKSCPAGCNCPRVPRHVRTRPQATSSIFHSGSPFASVDIERAYQVEKVSTQFAIRTSA